MPGFAPETRYYPHFTDKELGQPLFTSCKINIINMWLDANARPMIGTQRWCASVNQGQVECDKERFEKQ